MKLCSSSAWVPALAFFLPPAKANDSSAATPVARGLQVTLWAWTTQSPGPGGQMRGERRSFIRLETGLNRWNEDNQAWEESKVEIPAERAVSRKTAHCVIFAPNLKTPGAMDCEMEGELNPDHPKAVANPTAMEPARDTPQRKAGGGRELPQGANP